VLLVVGFAETAQDTREHFEKVRLDNAVRCTPDAVNVVEAHQGAQAFVGVAMCGEIVQQLEEGLDTVDDIAILGLLASSRVLDCPRHKLGIALGRKVAQEHIVPVRWMGKTIYEKCVVVTDRWLPPSSTLAEG